MNLWLKINLLTLIGIAHLPGRPLTGFLPHLSFFFLPLVPLSSFPSYSRLLLLFSLLDSSFKFLFLFPFTFFFTFFSLPHSLIFLFLFLFHFRYNCTDILAHLLFSLKQLNITFSTDELKQRKQKGNETRIFFWSDIILLF